MCFDHDSTPPIPAGERVITASSLTLTAQDGNEFAAYEATGTEPSRAAIVILPDVRGLFRFYEDLTSRFAQAGHDAIAIDYFGRTAGVSDRTNDWDFMPHVKATTLTGIRDDVAAAVARLRAHDPGRSVFTVGFCFGGSNSWHQAANGLGISGAVGFYGRPRRDGDSVIDRVGDMTCPILALMGGADPSIPREAIDEFEAALDAAGVDSEIVVYEGAPHSFFDRKYEEFADASADAWQRVLTFINTHT
ncbi:MAG: dienelactone hydrolase family protein [Acidimicrobiia bacterium]